MTSKPHQALWAQGLGYTDWHTGCHKGFLSEMESQPSFNILPEPSAIFSRTGATHLPNSASQTSVEIKTQDLHGYTLFYPTSQASIDALHEHCKTILTLSSSSSFFLWGWTHRCRLVSQVNTHTCMCKQELADQQVRFTNADFTCICRCVHAFGMDPYQLFCLFLQFHTQKFCGINTIVLQNKTAELFWFLIKTLSRSHGEPFLIENLN